MSVGRRQILQNMVSGQDVIKDHNEIQKGFGQRNDRRSDMLSRNSLSSRNGLEWVKRGTRPLLHYHSCRGQGWWPEPWWW